MRRSDAKRDDRQNDRPNDRREDRFDRRDDRRQGGPHGYRKRGSPESEKESRFNPGRAGPSDLKGRRSPPGMLIFFGLL